MKNDNDNRGARTVQRRRLKIGAAVTALGLACSLGVAQADDPSDTGPVDTATGTEELLEGALEKLVYRVEQAGV